MSNHKKGNLDKHSSVIKVDDMEIIDINSKAVGAGMSTGDIVSKVVEVAPAVVESISGAYNMRQQTLQEREKTKGLEIETKHKIAELQSTTAQILSENDKQIQALRNEDSKHERETNLERENVITEREMKLKELDHKGNLEMKNLEEESEKRKSKTSTIELWQDAFRLKMEKGEDYSFESKMLMEAIQKLDR
ncbi:hypothetical protein IQ781_06195 [Bacillus sp. N447-1]|uniref:hypothetical protein n=1 Tax=Bacillus TaxID=1386 RepID=UPI001F617AD2|nr:MULTISPECIES: hypothetical protein [Bacillus]HDR4425396.1 hypothetical protein [Bacillus cereus]MDA2145835.1 hypothetical protein [Bacillus cereus group sp. Bc248]MDA2173685.1 hypothetical protein [Bacillus cereus group sp. Bc247]MDA2664054.1 hypothetical protein [Bacillus cereus group sp. Bc032]MDA2674772.1 hypothetical protein [Bacillus cereus group sp. Bc031]